MTDKARAMETGRRSEAVEKEEAINGGELLRELLYLVVDVQWVRRGIWERMLRSVDGENWFLLFWAKRS